MSLRYRIFLVYSIIVAVIIYMTAILLHGYYLIKYIEEGKCNKSYSQNEVRALWWRLSELGVYGEAAILGSDEALKKYQEQVCSIDSLLQRLDYNYLNNTIDTLQILLKQKQKNLLHIIQNIRRRRVLDSLITEQWPITASNTRMEIRRKKGLAGFFGGKDTVQICMPSKNLSALSKQINNLREEYLANHIVFVDSLYNQNYQLSQRLSQGFALLDQQICQLLDDKDNQIGDLYHKNVLLCICTSGIVICALILSYVFIRKDAQKQEIGHVKLNEIIEHNQNLLNMSRKIILTISHDIRAPLSIINGCAELAMGTRDRKKRNSHLDNIRVVCKHILHLLNNLLDVYRLNEAKETRHDIPFRLSDLLERIALGFTHTANSKGLLFQHNFEGVDVTVCGDSDRIEQIADNLLSNAIKFTEAGSVSFIACHKDGTLLLTVKDTGIGMSEETVARIFDPFERSAPDTNAEGFGLGLSITKGLVGLLDGEITVASEVGKGSTFRVSLPLPLTDETVENEEQVSNPSARLPQRVLAIDDDPLQLEIVKEKLERNGVSCTTCVNTRTLVGEMRKADYDLLLSDIQMDGTNGFDLLELLRNSNIGNSRTIPVVAMTARGDKEKEAFASAGFTACIHKPFSMHELLDLIASVVSDTKSEVVSADFDTFTAEVRDKKRLLRTFIEQSNKDIEQLRKAGNDRERLREIVHRMLPMWELLQTDEPLLSYRNVLHDDKADDNMVGEYTQQIIDYAALLIAEAENKLNEYKE